MFLNIYKTNVCVWERKSFSTCCGKDASNNAAESDEKLPQWHVLLCDFNHQGADVILHEDPRHSMAACSMIYYPLLHKKIDSALTQPQVHQDTVHILMHTDYWNLNIPAQWLSTGVSLLQSGRCSVLWALWWWSTGTCDYLEREVL